MNHHKFVSIAFLTFLLLIVIICSIFQRSYDFQIYPKPRHVSRHLNEQDWREFQEFREWKKLRDDFSNERNEGSWNDNRLGVDMVKDTITPIQKSKIDAIIMDPPPSDHPALVGRYVVNQATWASAATISIHEEIFSFPFANVVAVSDGPLGNGTGIPYIYLSPLDFTAKDIAVNPRVTLMMTLAQGLFCQQHLMDPIDPRCARAILSGKIQMIQAGGAEYDFAKSVIFNRHPTLINMPADHRFFFAKLEIEFIAILDTYGGAKFVSIRDYFYPTRLHQKFIFNNSSRILS